jgi:uncharacterized protein (TIGR03083 family)
LVEVLTQRPPEARVPACPHWDTDDLPWHLGQVQWFCAAIIGRGPTVHAEVENLDSGGRPAGRDGLLALFWQASHDLHHNLAAASPQTSAWTWSQDQTVRFIRRRQAHETLIHRADAELTAGDRAPMDPDLRTDGVDEALRFLDTATAPSAHFAPDPAHSVRVQTTDTGRSWLVTLGRRTGTEDDGRPHDQPPPAGGGMGRGRFRARRAGLCRPERDAARSGRPLAVAPADRWPSRPGWGTFGP